MRHPGNSKIANTVISSPGRGLIFIYALTENGEYKQKKLVLFNVLSKMPRGIKLPYLNN